MADIEIATDSSDLKVAIDLLKDYEQAFVGMVNKVQTESNRLSRASKATSDQVGEAFDRMVNKINNDALTKTISDEARLLKQREQNWKQFFSQDYLKQQSGLSAKNSIFVEMLEKEERAAKAAMKVSQDLAREKDMLTFKYAPLTAAADKYKLEQDGLNLAMQKGIITSDSYKKQLAQLEKEYNALGKGVYLAGSRFNQFGQMADGSGKSAQRFGMYAQHAGYQLGDFAVQVQSGTNVGVAFSQQFAQLAGLIPGLAGALATFGAIGLGLLIQNMTRSKKETKELETALKDLSNLDDVFKNAGASLQDNLGGAIEKVRKQYGDFVADVSQMTVNAKIKDLVTGLKDSLPKATSLDPNSDGKGFFGKLPGYFASVEEAGKARKAANEYNETLLIIHENLDNLANQDFYSTTQAVEFLASTFQQLKESAAVTDEQLQRFGKELDDKGVLDAVLSIYNQRIEREAELQVKIQDRFDALSRELQMSEAILEYGEKHSRVKALEKQQTLEVLEVELQRLGMSQDLIDAALEMESAIIDTKAAAEDVKRTSFDLLGTLETISGLDISGVFSRAKGEAYQLLGIARSVSAALGNLGKLGIEGKALAAENAALANKMSPKRAKLEGDLVRDQAKIPGFESLPTFMQNMYNTANRASREQNLTYQEENDSYTKAYNDANKKSKGGGKGKKPKKTDDEKYAEKYQDFLNKMEIHMEQQEKLVGLYGAERERQEKIIEIENRLGDARHLASQKQIAAWAEEELALEHRLEREKQLYDTLNSGFENFIMTVVTGTNSIEDAFKAMLFNIIKEVYQNMVAKPAAGLLSDLVVGLFSAKGNAFGSGGVKMFAKGGVVDSPTAFNYSGGLGVMGEAGPESIMPLKRNSQGQLGVIASGGQSGNIVVQQTFNYSANGDEAVKNIIKSSMPEIANRTKSVIIQAKARGEKGL